MTKILQVSINDKKWINIFKKSLERQRKHEGGDSSYASIIRDSILLREKWVFGEGEFANNPHYKEVKALSTLRSDLGKSLYNYTIAHINKYESVLEKTKNMIWCRRKFPTDTERKIKELKRNCKTQIAFLKKFVQSIGDTINDM